jgi:hypothetical protein
MNLARRLGQLLQRWRRARARRRAARAEPDAADLGTGWGMEQSLSAGTDKQPRR